MCSGRGITKRRVPYQSKPRCKRRGAAATMDYHDCEVGRGVGGIGSHRRRKLDDYEGEGRDALIEK